MSMKYDAGMTQYHSNIATAIKRMCRHDKTAMKLVKDASPAPLREHLKKSYKYNGAGDASSFYQGSPKDMKIEFNGESIILSWSQVAKFIRDNPSEIFDDYNALSNQPVCECNTENNKTYLEVFREHYRNVKRTAVSVGAHLPKVNGLKVRVIMFPKNGKRLKQTQKNSAMKNLNRIELP